MIQFVKAISLVVAAALLLAQGQRGPTRRHPTVLEGKALQGYSIAVAYLQSPGGQGAVPFDVKNYRVAFEGQWTYHFIPHRTREDEDRLDFDTSVGPAVRVTVDPKTMKVISAVVE